MQNTWIRIAIGMIAAMLIYGHSGKTIAATTEAPGSKPSPTVSAVADLTASPSPARLATGASPTPTNPEQLAQTLLERAQSELDHGDYSPALADFTGVIRLNPNAPEAFLGRGKVFDNLKQYSNAVADFTEAIRLKPGYAEAYVNRDKTYDHMKQYDKALASLTEVIRLKPDNVDAYRSRGYLYYSLE
jgi:tetratricopeptide (TPR) repeat protein